MCLIAILIEFEVVKGHLALLQIESLVGIESLFSRVSPHQEMMAVMPNYLDPLANLEHQWTAS